LLVGISKGILLTCEGHAAPTPSITWMRDGVTLTNTSNVNIVTSVVTHDQRNIVSTLNVMRFAVTGEGNYSCSVSNSAGIVISNGIVLSEY